ncbi:accessory gland protein Acp29AB-like [Drosophila gunungcola]|uniref:accessory gland protein Acp29AB-like n=1 Tax=Drosophila gunungcola TaxID=103775 RepID=UPI0022DEAC23|nr:accessory gland protein Acp29AB-like [Drosophila gunungcola]
MIKSASNFVFGFTVLSLLCLAKAEESNCVLKDAPNQCGAFCLSALHPVFDHHVKHHQQWASIAFLLNDTRVRLDKIQKDTQDRLEKIQNDTQTKLDKIQNDNRAMQSQLSAIMETLTALNTSIKTKEVISSNIQSGKFEQIGSRYFYIERNKTYSWDDAANKCLGMGGYLASFRNQEELDTIQPKLDANQEYWLGINNRANLDQFITVASGRPAKFLKWKSRQPRLSSFTSKRVIYMSNGEMGVGWSPIRCFFICQADNEV